LFGRFVQPHTIIEEYQVTKTLDEIMSGRGEPMPTPENPETTTAVVDPAPNPEPESQPQPDASTDPQPSPEPKMVPVAALEEERAKRRKYTDELADTRKELENFRNQFQGFMQAFQAPQRPQQQPQQPPDFFDDPNAFVQHTARHEVEPISQEFQAYKESMSHRMAIKEYGEEAVGAAYQAMDRHIAELSRTQPQLVEQLKRQLLQSPDPYADIVAWHKKQQALEEIGSDPQAFREKLRRELLEELKAQQPSTTAQAAQPAAAQPNPAAMPSNFAQSRSAGPRTGVTWTGPQPLSAIMNR
jgi:hypothetical protein